MKEKFSGIWPAMFTPINNDGEPALDQVEKLVELFISQKLGGIYILGSTGQGLLFTEEQRKQVTRRVAGISKGRIPIIVQVGALTTAEAVRLARYAEQCGVDAISSVGPVYYSGNAAMALEHYKGIASSTQLPFFPYQLGENFIPGDTIQFVNQLLNIPHIAGMKLTTNQLLEISSIHNYAGEKLKLFSGSDELFCHASLCGTVGAIGSFYNIWGLQCKQVLMEFKNGNYALAQEFMLGFQKVICKILPNSWTFFRKAMLLKYQIDIGEAKAPLGNTQIEWEDEAVMNIFKEIESLAVH
ncbi:MAG: dihydrodipicolinate synthase family protein [Chitinophagaceae bacterium]|jgi:N-acetylneuraminate lyase|nr:MAG: dihydrodipicolinate synthase family protein [Chitinophagaceae bacterium]